MWLFSHRTASYGSGHWYEGGGLIRPVFLLARPRLYLVTRSVTCPPESDRANIRIGFAVQNDGDTAAHPHAMLRLRRLGPDDALVGDTGMQPLPVLAAGQAASHAMPLRLLFLPPALWDVNAPAMYRLTVTVCSGGPAARVVVSPNTTVVAATVPPPSCWSTDVVNVTVGFRSVRWDVAGLHLNSRRQQLRGFSNHNSFAGLGVRPTPKPLPCAGPSSI